MSNFKTELKEGDTSKQLIKVETAFVREGDYGVFSYTRLDTNPPKPNQKVKMPGKNIAKELADQLKALKVGDEVAITKTKVGDSWPVTAVADKTTFVAKPKNDWKGKGGGYTKPAYNSDGARTGCMFNNVVLLGISRGTTDVDSLKKIADEVKSAMDYLENGGPSKTVDVVSNINQKDEITDFDDDFNW